MQSRLVTSVILSVLVAAPVLAGLAPVGVSQVPPSVTLPDTSCASAVGVGPDDIPHAYYTANGVVTFTNDACPDHYSGELGFGFGGVWLFSREGSGLNGGDGVVACYGDTDPTAGPTTGHHGAHTTINVRDDVNGGNVAFTVTSDWNRTEDNPFLPSSNNAGDSDCGDSLVEPCADETEYNTAPGCNPLDRSVFVPAGAGAWTTPATLADEAGADGAIVVFIETDLASAAVGTSGAVWTGNEAQATGKPGHVHATIHHFPESNPDPALRGSYFLWGNLEGWTCYDVNNGNQVGLGDPLSDPSPGITCVPDVGVSNVCNTVVAGGYHADGSGTLEVTSACAGLSTTATLTLPFPNEQVDVETGVGLTPWTCTVDDSLVNNVANVDYWVFCEVQTS